MEEAWSRLIELSRSETLIRAEGLLPLNFKDPVADAWNEASRHQFQSAWAHVASMASADDIRNDYAAFLVAPNKATVRRVMEALAVDVAGVLNVLRSDEGARTFKAAISAIEGVLVACLGHYSPRPRALAVRLLNALYDGVDWQVAAPLPPVMAQVGDRAVVDVYTAYNVGGGGDPTEQFRVVVCAPSFDRAMIGGAGGGDHIQTMHAPVPTLEEVWTRVPVLPSGGGGGGSGTASGGATPAGDGASPTTSAAYAAVAAAGSSLEDAATATAPSPDGSFKYLRVRAYRVRLSLAPFPRCGYYDWRLVAVSGATGHARPVPQLTPILGHELAQLVAQGLLPASPADGGAGAGGPMSPVLAPPAMLQQAAPGAGGVGVSGTRGAGGGSDSAGPSDPGAAGATSPASMLALAQGRYIVHRAGLKDEHIHEVVVDLEGMRFSEGGEIVRHGTFADVAGGLRGLRTSGVTSLFVLGALERDNGWGERDPDPSDPAVVAAAEQGAVVPSSAAGAKEGGAAAAAATAAAPPTATVPLNEYTTHHRGGDLGLGAHVGLSGGGGVHHSSSGDSVAESDFGFFSMDAPTQQQPAHGTPGASGQLTALLGASSPPQQQLQPGGGSGGEGEERAPAGVRAYAARPDANPYAVVDRHTPNRMLGGQLGFARLCAEARGLGMRLLVQLDASISASRPHRKYKHLYARTLDTAGQTVIHHGTDALENQWEDTQLLNYRKVEAWDTLVSEAKTLVQNFGVGGLVLSDAQSYPFIMAMDTSELFRKDVDGEGHYSPREILEGEVVIANTEIGYWTTKAARSYANPLLVKLTRALWAIAPDFTVVGECHWGRAGALQRSGVVPRCTDVVSAMASTIGRFVDKNGTITPFSLPGNVQPVHFLRALVAGEAAGVVPPQAAPQFVQGHLSAGGDFPPPLSSLLEGPGGPLPRGGAAMQLRSLSTARLPYPALLLGRSAWTGVDLLYTLPGVPCTFGEEKAGRAYRVDVTGTYTYNPAYLEEEKKKAQKRAAAEKHVLRTRHARSGSSAGASTGLPPGAAAGAAGGTGMVRGTDQSRYSSATGLDAMAGGGSASGGSPQQPGALGSGWGPMSFPPLPVGGSGGSSSGGVYDPLLGLEGDIGVGGVVPAMPVRGAPSYKIARTGFSHLNLASLATLAPGESPHHGSGGGQVSPHTLGLPPSGSPPGGVLGSGRGGFGGGNGGGSGGGGGAGMTRTFGSSPALQSLLLSGVGGELPGLAETGVSSQSQDTDRSGGVGGGGEHGAGGTPAGLSAGGGDEGQDDDEEDEEDDDVDAAAAGIAAMTTDDRPGSALGVPATSNFGFQVALPSPHAAGHTALPGGGVAPLGGRPPRNSFTGGSGSTSARGSKLRESWTGAGDESAPPQTSAPTTVAGGDATSLASGAFRVRSPPNATAVAGKAGRAGSSASSASSEITRVTSWAAMDSMTFKGGDGMGLGAGGAALRDNLKQLAAMEARLRSEVGPQYGFDLAQIAGHYDHRRLLRGRYPVLREGDLATLAAHHRYGEHGHVFAFARTVPGQVAVVASNFNGHPSTFTVDCSPLVAAFGAATTAEASSSVAQLMSASIAVGEALNARLSGAPASSTAGGPPPLALSRYSVSLPPLGPTTTLPSLNLKGGVWEVRDIFASDYRRLAVAGGFDGPHAFSEADGPLVGIMTSEEAAYAPMLTTLPPHRSYCWLYVAAAGSTGSAAGRTPLARSGAPAGGAALDRELETDPAAMQWLFASSLLRLQSVMRLKETGLASAIVTRAEVAAAGGPDKLLFGAGRKLGAGEPWIAPGEALKDGEIQAAARQNLVYALLRHCVKRCVKALAAVRREAGGGDPVTWSSVTAPAGARSDATRAALDRVLSETSLYLEAALRVLVTHWRLRPQPPQPGRNEPPTLVAEPLPSLHGAMNRPGGIDGGSGELPAGSEGAWYCIDGEAAVAIARTALFLAVKDVVGQAAGRAAAAAAAAGASPTSATSAAGGGALPTSGPGPSDISDEDGVVSALLVKALVRIARGRTAAGAALSAASGGGDAASAAAGVAASLTAESAVVAFAHRLLWRNSASPLVFVTPELGKWSTVGGLGVMVDELSIGLAELGLEVICVSPYYHVNRKGGTDYLRADGITYTGRNVAVYAGPERIEMGVHEGKVKGVRLFFLHNADVFPRPYPPHDAFNQIRVMAAFAKGTLELLCQWRLIPGVVVTNDWFTGLVPAYARHGHFGDAFQRTDFMHIAHNLDPDYEGRMWPTPAQGTLGHVHGLPSDLLVDPHWHDVVINPTRAALLCSDTWATVSRSYRADLLSGSPLRALLRLAPHPFAHPNGIPVKARAARLASLPTPTHEDAKAALQRKYFGFAAGDPSIPLFAFVGRITLQKGVHLILQAVDELLRVTGGRAMFLVGGMASGSDTYGLGCAHVMRDLAARHPSRFWANPDLFFTDGDMVNLGADFCMMPSMFEPGGIVQQEFFVAGTPVIAFKTGGLKDTVHEWHPGKRTGNGFTFEAHNAGDFSAAVHRALAVYADGPSYAQLRANARASVMDLAVVSLGWAREFYRLRRCLPPAPTPPAPEALVPFAISVGEVPGLSAESTVELTGSWTAWARKYPLTLEQPGRRAFSTALPLPPGTYQFKFVVDGVWTAAPSLSTVDDGTGNINNVVSVAPPHHYLYPPTHTHTNRDCYPPHAHTQPAATHRTTHDAAGGAQRRCSQRRRPR